MRTRRSNREKGLGLLTAVIVGGVAVYVFLLEPPWRARKALMEQQTGTRLRLVKIQNDMRLKDYIDKTFREVESLIAGASNENQEMSVFSRQLRDLSSGLGLKHQFRPLPMVREKYYRVLSMRVEVGGNVRTVLDFMNRIERLPSPVNVRNCEMKAQAIEDTIQATLTVCKIVATPET